MSFVNAHFVTYVQDGITRRLAHIAILSITSGIFTGLG